MRSFRPAMFVGFALAVVLGACDDASVTGAADRVSIEVEPSGQIILGVGDTLTLRATARNATRDPSVRFTSTDTAVVTVSGAGLLRGSAPGLTTVLIRSAQDTAVQRAVAVRVADASTLPPTSARPSVGIESLVDLQNRLVSPDNVSGLVVVRLSVERGTATRAEVLLGGTVACALDFSTTATVAAGGLALAKIPVTLVCPVDTARFDPATGVPTFRNGGTVLSARLLGPGGATLADAGSLALTLRNSNMLATSARADRAAADETGRQWLDGDLAVSALPVAFDSTAALARVTFAFSRPDGAEVTVIDSVAPFTALLREAVELRDVADPTLRVRISSVLRSGQAGPSAEAGPVAYDNRPPTPGTLAGPAWIAASTRFASLYTSAQAEPGVGGVRVRFFAGDPGLSVTDLVIRGTSVETGNDLPESREGAYALAALVCDALENCVFVEGFSFGVDRTPPQIGSAGVEDRAINPQRDLELGLADNRSGFGTRPVVARVLVLDNDAGTSACGPTVEGADLPGRPSGSACLPDTVGAVIPVPRARAGYYSYVLEPIDRAGNLGGPDIITILVDIVAPAVAEFSLSSPLVAGDGLTVSASVSDNLDLTEASLSLVFPTASGSGSFAVPFGMDTLGSGFDGGLDPIATVRLRIPHFVRTLTYSTAGTASSSWTTVLIDSIQIRAVDAAGLVGHAGLQVPAATLAGANLEPFRSLSGVSATLSTPQFCNQDCFASDPDSALVTLRITGGTSSGAPFARVYFFETGADGRVTLAGSVGTPTSTSDSGSQRTTVYTFEFRPRPGRLGAIRLFAVGVTSTGAALRSEDLPMTLISR